MPLIILPRIESLHQTRGDSHADRGFTTHGNYRARILLTATAKSAA
jgi:hypothetical protein